MIIEKVVNGSLVKMQIPENKSTFYAREGWKRSKEQTLPVVKKTWEKKVEDNNDDNGFESFKKKK